MRTRSFIFANTTVLLLLLCVEQGSCVSKIAAAAGYATATCLAAMYLTEVVTTGNEILVERFGKFHRKIGPGWHLLLKPIDRVSFRCQLREQLLDVPPQQCYTVDNAPITADAVVYLRIVDAHKAKYAVADISSSIQSLVLTKIREQVSLLTLDESFTSRDKVNQALLKDLSQIVDGWGVVITRVEVQDLQPSRDILKAMELQMSAERQKRAAILKSEGQRSTLINTAEGTATAALARAKADAEVIELMATAEATRLRLQAEGWKAAIATVSRVMAGSGSGGDKAGVNAALQLLLWKQYMDTQAAFASSNSTKTVLFPTKDSIPLTHPAMKSLLH